MIFKLKLLWASIKKNWKLALLAIWSVVVWFISRKNAEGAIEAMKANKESYESQIASLKSEHKIEKEKLEQLNLKYRETIATIEKKCWIAWQICWQVARWWRLKHLGAILRNALF